MKYEFALATIILMLAITAGFQACITVAECQDTNVAPDEIQGPTTIEMGPATVTAGPGVTLITGDGSLNTTAAYSNQRFTGLPGDIPGPAKGINVTGSWSIALQDSMARSLNLILYQREDAILGYGTLTFGGEKDTVTAGGRETLNSLDLFVVTTDGQSLYSLSLIPSGESISGTYTAYTSNGITWVGTANGTTVRSESASQASSVPVAIGSGFAQTSGASNGSLPTVVSIGGTGVTSASAPVSGTPTNNRRIISKSISSTYDGMTTTTTGDSTGDGSATTTSF